jgi:hypothetical protein
MKLMKAIENPITKAELKRYREAILSNANMKIIKKFQIEK